MRSRTSPNRHLDTWWNRAYASLEQRFHPHQTYFPLLQLELPVFSAFALVQDPRHCFRPWSSARRVKGELVVQSVGLRVARDYITGAAHQPKGWLQPWTCRRGVGEILLVVDNLGAQRIRDLDYAMAC